MNYKFHGNKQKSRIFVKLRRKLFVSTLPEPEPMSMLSSFPLPLPAEYTLHILYSVQLILGLRHISRPARKSTGQAIPTAQRGSAEKKRIILKFEDVVMCFLEVRCSLHSQRSRR